MAAVTGSAVVYFLQPTLGTMMVAMAFLASVPLRRPLAAKVATDLVPLPAGFLANQRRRGAPRRDGRRHLGLGLQALRTGHRDGRFLNT